MPVRFTGKSSSYLLSGVRSARHPNQPNPQPLPGQPPPHVPPTRYLNRESSIVRPLSLFCNSTYPSILAPHRIYLHRLPYINSIFPLNEIEIERGRASMLSRTLIMSNTTAANRTSGSELPLSVALTLPVINSVIGLLLVGTYFSKRKKVKQLDGDEEKALRSVILAKVHKQKWSFAFERSSLEKELQEWRLNVRRGLTESFVRNRALLTRLVLTSAPLVPMSTSHFIFRSAFEQNTSCSRRVASSARSASLGLRSSYFQGSSWG